MQSVHDLRNASLIDDETIERIFDLDRAGEAAGSFLRELLDLFEQTSDQVMPLIIQAHQNSDLEVLHRMTHKLKGLSANVAAHRLAMVFETIEKASGAGQAYDHEVYRLIEPTYAATRSALADILRNRKAA